MPSPSPDVAGRSERVTGRAAFLRLLIDEGVTHLFGNPGTTELALMEVVPQFPQLRYVMALQESLVVAMADGFARATGQLAACNLHCMPGLGHAMGALYSAKFCGSPLIVTAGQYEIGHGLTEPMLYEPLVPVAAPLVKWAVEVERLADLPRIVRRAAKIATTPPTGPVFVSLPGSVLDEEGAIDLGRRTRVLTAVRPADDQLEALADRLLAAERPVMIVGGEIARRDAIAEAAELATLLGAPVWHEAIPYNARFPVEHPLAMGDLTRSQPKVRATLEPHDLLVCLGADLLRMSPHHPVEPLPPALPVIHVSERDHELGKNYPTELAIRADVRQTLLALLPIVRGRRTTAQARRAAAGCARIADDNWSVRRERRAQQVATRDQQAPIDQDWLMWRLAQALPERAIVVEETLTCSAALSAFVKVREPDGFFGLASGGLGFGLPGAVGVALAKPSRPVAAILGDGSALYAIQALWTAAHLKLPIRFVIVNNASYRIIKDRLVSMRGTDAFTGMDIRDPAIDFVAVAHGFGIAATRVTAAADVDAALRAAFDDDRPSLAEIVVDDGYGAGAAGHDGR
jgi:benzoylformate decarboxylase